MQLLHRTGLQVEMPLCTVKLVPAWLIYRTLLQLAQHTVPHSMGLQAEVLRCSRKVFTVQPLHTNGFQITQTVHLSVEGVAKHGVAG